MSASGTAGWAPPMDGSIGGALGLYYPAMAGGSDMTTPRAGADSRDAALAREGDGDAYERIVRRHQGTVAAQMWRFTRDPVHHAELVQDVFVEAYLSLHGFAGRSPFLHWLRKIAVRRGYAFWRARQRRKAEVPLEPELAETLATDPARQNPSEAADAVHRTLDRLPPRDRLVLTLFHLDGYSMAEVAEIVGWTRTMVKVQAWRARRKLEKLLRAEGIDEA